MRCSGHAACMGNMKCILSYYKMSKEEISRQMAALMEGNVKEILFIIYALE